MSNVIPLVPSILVREEDVTLGRLSSLLDSVFIDHEEDEDGDLYLSQGVGFPLWVSLDQPRKLLRLFTYSEIDEEDQKADWTARVNRMNTDLILVRFYRRGEVVFGDYSVSYEGGLSPRLFIRVLQRFADIFPAGLRLHKRSRAKPLLP